MTKLIPGNLITLKITAIGPNNVGMNEFSFGLPILIPNTKLGDTVQVKVLKVLTSKKIAIAKLIKVITSTKNSSVPKQINKKVQSLQSLTPGTSLTITINKLGPNATAIADLPKLYFNVTKVVVKNPLIKLGETITVKATRIKKGYAFAVIDDQTVLNKTVSTNIRESNSNGSGSQFDILAKQIGFKGTKFTVILPKKAKRYLKHIVFKVVNLSQPTGSNLNAWGDSTLASNRLGTPTILFVKPSLGAKLGDKVQIQITKILDKNPSLEGSAQVAIAKIIKLNPVSATLKKTLVRANIRQMLKSGMHYGEKAIRCNARMKNYVWTRKKTNRITSPLGNFAAMTYGRHNTNSLQELDLAASPNLISWEARPLIKKGRNIINLLKTRRCLNKALAQLTKYAVKGKTFLFVGTKKAASGLVSRAALFSKKAFFVNTRWLGGMLTNWKTILKSISKIRPILKEKQMIIKDILEKRQNIKTRLIQKALLLRKKCKLMLKKGRSLIQMLKLSSKSQQNLEKTDINVSSLNTKRKELISKGILLLEKQRQLALKQKELILQSQTLKSKAILLTNNYRQLLNNLMLSRKKLRELKALLLISKELQAFKHQAKQDNTNLYMVSNNKSLAANKFIISNPPKEILNKMVSLIKETAKISQTETNNRIESNNLNLKAVNSAKTLILTQLLSKFNLFIPTIKIKIKNLQTYITTQKVSLNKIVDVLTTIKNQIALRQTIKNKVMVELQKIKRILQVERNIIRVLRRKLKQISAQKRLIKFLPKLRYLPTPANKIEETARFLMKRFVDPKMKYPMDIIYDEKLNRQSKKIAASRKKKWQRLEKYLGGISNMTKIKEKQIRNNVAIIIGQQEEMNAVRECKKLGIKMFHIVDTNCNPGFADHFIPANDDARNSIKFILGKFLTRIRLAQKLKQKMKKIKNKKIRIRKNKK
uniref:Ribosomal protein S2 n=1 Tax=Volvulina compacta TaxID=51721 RepID=A0A6C0RV28_9CHLO|nr:ribosomal protein S2 [Volvulina compacta]